MSRRYRPPERQFVTSNGWSVSRRRGRDTQHAYYVMYRGQEVGWILREGDGWRWLLTWSPGTLRRPPRFFIERTSRGVYRTWQLAVNAIARTDVGQRIAGRDGPSGAAWERHYSVRGEPWVPRPAKQAAAVSR